MDQGTQRPDEPAGDPSGGPEDRTQDAPADDGLHTVLVIDVTDPKVVAHLEELFGFSRERAEVVAEEFRGDWESGMYDEEPE